MGINFRKRIRLGKYANVNVGKTGAGFSFGIPGARISVNSKGRTQASLGIPGTGLSYTKVLGTKKNKKKTQDALKDGDADAEYTLESYDDALFALTHIHTEVGDDIDFSRSTLQYQSREIGPHQQQALQELEDYKPSLLDKVFKRDKAVELKEKVYEAIEKDHENRQWHTVDSNLHDLINKKDKQGLQRFLDMVDAFAVFEDDCEGYDLEFDMNVDEVEGLLITVKTNIAEDVIDEDVSQNPSGSLKVKKLSKTAFNERSYAYVCSLTLGFVREAMAFLPFDTIHINVVDVSKNPNTGFMDTKNIVAAEYEREDLSKYDFDHINPMEVFLAGLVDVDFSKRNGFKEVEPISVDD